MFTSIRRLSIPIIVGCAFAAPSRAQCAEWDPRFAPPGTNGAVHALVEYDDGSGPALYLGGTFTAAGDVAASNIAKWDGEHWSPLAGGTNGTVYSLAVFNGELYAGGNFVSVNGGVANRIAKWNGSSWSGLSTGLNFGAAFALRVWDDGSGPALFVAGLFTSAGGVPANSIAKWNGASFSALGTGITGGVRALAVFDDGLGTGLYAGGEFATAGGFGVANIARWNGSSWSPLGSGIAGAGSGVTALETFDDGSGLGLFVGGHFASAGGAPASNVARWKDFAWSAVGGGTNDGLWALHAFDGALFAGGDFTFADSPARHVARWDGASWAQIESGTDATVRAFADFAGVLAVGGDFGTAGRVKAEHVASYSSTWKAIGDGMGLSDATHTLVSHNDGTSVDLYAGGKFRFAGHTGANYIAKWNGDVWSGVGAGMDNEVYALASFDDGTGRVLVAGGIFALAGNAPAARIAQWNATTWAPIGAGMSGGPVYSLLAWGSGPGAKLVAGGGFTTAGGGSANRIAQWNGTTWSALGTGVTGSGLDTSVYALALFDDGTGAKLYAGGTFVTAGGVTVNHVAKWNGTSWSALGTGMSGSGAATSVRALAVFDDGSGPKLHAAGEFTSAGGVMANRVARWNGSSWSALGQGADDTVHALVVLNDLNGHALYAGGEFATAGGVAANRIAKWDGAQWSALATGIDAAMEPVVRALAIHDDGSDGAPDLYAAGKFEKAGPTYSSSIAEWHGCPAGQAYCFGDDLDPAVTADCPCGNFGAPGHGCANSNDALGGALLSVSGTTSPNTIALTCTGIPNTTLCTFLRASQSTSAGAVFGDGLLCLQGTLVRFGSQNAGLGGNPGNSVSTGTAAVPAGSVRYYQVQYRNINPVFCTSALFNVSNAHSISW